jgi:hypothetical protein
VRRQIISRAADRDGDQDAVNSSIRTTPSTVTLSFAACRVSRSSDTSLKASAPHGTLRVARLHFERVRA